MKTLSELQDAMEQIAPGGVQVSFGPSAAPGHRDRFFAIGHLPHNRKLEQVRGASIEEVLTALFEQGEPVEDAESDKDLFDGL